MATVRAADARQVREDVWKTSEIRSGKVAWQDLANARLIAAADVDLMIRFQREPPSAQAQYVLDDHLAYAEVFMTLLRNVSSRPECTHYVLTALDEMMSENDKVATIFERILVHPSLRPFAVLADLLRAQAQVRETDELVVARSCNVLAHLLQAGLVAPSEDAKVLLDWVISDLQAGGGGNGARKKNVQQSVVGLLAALLRDPKARIVFAETNGVRLLTPILNTPNPNQNLQLLYLTLCCLWMVSYSAEGAPRLADPVLLRAMLDIVKSVMKEKVIRMALACWRNLMTVTAAKEALVDIGTTKVLTSFKSRNFSDEDVVEDVQFVLTALEGIIQTKSTFDEYRKEVLSSELDWSPVHRSVKFWEANYLKLTDKDNQLLAMLVNTLKPTTAGSTARNKAVACHDLGEFVRFHPGGKAILDKLGMKPLIMQLLTSSDEEVRKEALLCVQKLMVA